MALVTDSNLLGRYDEKLNEFENLIAAEPSNRQHVYDRDTYMTRTTPFLLEYNRQSVSDQHTVDTLFTGKNGAATREKKGIQKKDIYYEYLLVVEDYKGIFPKDPTKPKRSQIEGLLDKCKVCKGTNFLIDRLTTDHICVDCGVVVPQLGEELSYKEEQEHEYVFNYSYKRENHFNEWLTQFQAGETITVPSELIDNLRSEFKKQKIENLEQITYAKVRSFLKKLKYNKYYEHVPYITILLTGKKPMRMSNALEDKLRQMFKLIQEPFDKNCPSTRKNFLSYSYVLYKFCELLEEDEYLPYFSLLKSKEKLYQQDVIWRKMCGDLQWEFIPTV